MAFTTQDLALIAIAAVLVLIFFFGVDVSG